MSKIKIALAGNPNCGKTTMFNDLTGSSQYVGNWPGVTVEKKEGYLRGDKSIIIQDLPGIYSLSPYTLEEVVTRNYLLDEQPDVILNLVDGSNLERNLYLTTQLCEIGLPVVVAINMIDLVEKNGDKIDLVSLSSQLGCPVVATSALKGRGAKEAASLAVKMARGRHAVNKSDSDFDPSAPNMISYEPETENVLTEIASLLSLSGKVADKQLRWHAIKMFERDEKIIDRLGLGAEKMTLIEKLISAVEEKLDDDSESIITNGRYQYIAGLVKSSLVKNRPGELSASDKIDRVVTNRWLALPIFAFVMWLVYYLSIQTIGVMGTDWVNEELFGAIIPEAVEGWLVSLSVAAWLQSLILDGIIAGVGAVLGFLPQMMVLFLCLAVLEDCGYMARIAFIMDRIFRKFGLSGKSFIPLLVGTGCSVPGIMASRTIEKEKDRRMTVMVTSFIPCGAKLPVIALIAGALFPQVSWVGPSAYFLGIGAVILSGIILKKTRLFAGDPAPFVMELPAYHLPAAKGVLVHMWDRSKAFVKKAGTIIFAASALIWFMSSFNWSFSMVDADQSILASLGRVLAPLFVPLGWGEWRATVATVTGLIAKENIVGTFGVLYGAAEVVEDGVEIWPQLQLAFTQVSAYSFLVFNLLCAPCFAAIGAIHREMGNARWTWFAVGYQTLLAYASALIVYQLGSLIFLGASFGIGQGTAVVLVISIIWLLVRKPAKKTKNAVGTPAYERS